MFSPSNRNDKASTLLRSGQDVIGGAQAGLPPGYNMNDMTQ